ncbi:hypothetical protein WG66_001066 [Moniliophthora roreri]|uniref:Uncharacterized protein n=1 Tax=Moniliophthora roreri TaxID=221103 RepID=A0A0W0FJC9_MONRR|nr:hypothetical protein WG66_001066 [Moniliophthora roreri]
MTHTNAKVIDITPKIREKLQEYQDRPDALAYVQELCTFAARTDTAVKASVYHRDILPQLVARVCEVVYLLVCACSVIDCRDPVQRVFHSNYMKNVGEELTRVLKEVESFILTLNGTARMIRYNLYGQYDRATIQTYMASVYQALSPFNPPAESEITNSVQKLIVGPGTGDSSAQSTSLQLDIVQYLGRILGMW